MSSDFTGSARTSCRTRVRCFLHKCGDLFARLWEHQPVCLLATIPRQMGRCSRRIKTWAPLSGCHLVSWSSFLPWVEYAHNSLISSATGMTPFMASLGYQPPLFPEQERWRFHQYTGTLYWAQRVWRAARAEPRQSKQLIDIGLLLPPTS